MCSIKGTVLKVLEKRKENRVRPEKNKMDHPNKKLSQQTICKLNQGDSPDKNERAAVFFQLAVENYIRGVILSATRQPAIKTAAKLSWTLLILYTLIFSASKILSSNNTTELQNFVMFSSFSKVSL